MAGDLVRRRTSGADLLDNNTRALQRARGLLRQPAPTPIVEAAPDLGEVVDLPRMCAVHDQPYVSRYLTDGLGGIRYAQSIRLTQALMDQYATHHERSAVVPSGECEEEHCPWCGARGYGAVHCGSCRADVCYGRTNARDYFRCRPSCGSHGQLKETNWAMQGAAPLIRPRAQRSSGG